MTGLDTNTKLLLHCDGVDGSTTFTDSKLTSPHTVTAHGTAQVDTSVKKWGTGSLLLDGNSDYLSIPDSADWDWYTSSSSDFTIDMQVYHTDVDTYGYLFHQQSGNSRTELRITASNKIEYLLCDYDNSTLIQVESLASTIPSNEWIHIAFVKKGSIYGIYLDGVQVAYGSDSSTLTSIGAQLVIGVDISGLYYFGGNLDEIRFQGDNYFDVTPNVGLTSTIIVPTEAYSVDATARNQSIIIV